MEADTSHIVYTLTLTVSQVDGGRHDGEDAGVPAILHRHHARATQEQQIRLLERPRAHQVG